MLAGLDRQHDLVACKHARDGKDTTRQSLAEQHHVRLDVLVVAREHAPRAADAGLDLVGHKEDVVRGAELLRGGKIAVVRHVDARLALDGLQDECGDVGGALQRLLERLQVVVGDRQEAGNLRAIAAVAVRVRGGGHSAEGAAVEVVLGNDHLSLVSLDTLDVVGPAAGKLETGFPGLRTGVHGQHLVVAKVLADILSELAQGVVVEGTRGQGEDIGLLVQSSQDLGMAVALVHSGVGAEKVEVLLAINVPDMHALAAVQDNRQRVVVVGAILVLEAHEALRGGAQAGQGGVGAHKRTGNTGRQHAGSRHTSAWVGWHLG
eukprot:m.221006 g.221006  ORF g.221006 m.221006 type:complete len:320 (-) comp10495_c0_seq1:8-967(-)